MPAINTDSLLSHIWSILTPQQHAMVTNFVMTGVKTATTAKPSANTGQNRQRKRSTATKRARTSKAISPTAQALTTFFGANPGGHTLADLTKGTGLKANILGRTLKANNAFRQNGEMWLLNRGAVDRSLTSGERKAA